MPPGVRVIPAIETAEGFVAVKVWEPTVNMEAVGAGRWILLVPITRVPLEASELGVPEIVRAGRRA